MPFGYRAIRTLRETLVGDVEATIETRSKILPRDHGREFDELCVVEVLAKLLDLLVGRGRRRVREGNRVVEHLLLEVTERVAVAVTNEIS